MRKLALKLTVCVAALAATGTADAASKPTGIWIGNTGNVGLEITKCGSSLCGRMVRLKDGADNASCSPTGKAKVAGNSKTDKSDDESSFGMDALTFLAAMGSMLFSDAIVWKRAGDDVKKCEETASKAPMSRAPAAKKAAPAPVAYAPAKAPVASPKAPVARIAAPKIAAPVKSTIQAPVREATAKGYNCKKYFSQIGETILVPCD
jgi:hypothetical protein